MQVFIEIRLAIHNIFLKNKWIHAEDILSNKAIRSIESTNLRLFQSALNQGALMSDCMHCPKCNFELDSPYNTPGNFHECPQCGVIIEKYLQLKPDPQANRGADLDTIATDSDKGNGSPPAALARQGVRITFGLIAPVVVLGFIVTGYILFSDSRPDPQSLRFRPPYGEAGRMPFLKYNGVCESGVYDHEGRFNGYLEKADNATSEVDMRNLVRTMARESRREPYKSYECVLQASESTDPEERLALIRFMWDICKKRDIGVEDAYTIVKKMLHDESSAVRYSAASCLQMFSGDKPVEAAIDILLSEEDSRDVQSNLMRYLLLANTSRAREGFSHYMRSPYFVARGNPIFSVIKQSNDPDMASRLVHVMMDADIDERDFLHDGFKTLLAMADAAVPALGPEVLEKIPYATIKTHLKKVMQFHAERAAQGIADYGSVINGPLMAEMDSFSPETIIVIYGKSDGSLRDACLTQLKKRVIENAEIRTANTMLESHHLELTTIAYEAQELHGWRTTIKQQP